MTEPSGRNAGASDVGSRDVAARRRQLSGELDEIVLMALRKEPARRYSSVEQFAEDLRSHLDGRPVTAVKGSWKYRGEKFLLRHKIGAATTAAVFIALAAGVGATVREARIAAANEKRAEQRFNDVRKLANSLMFEIHDAIEPLPGATPARKLLVQRSLEYLDSLSHEASGDLSLQRELSNAYERIGLVQGNPQGSNLGDIPGALDSFNKALSIRQKVVDSSRDRNLADVIALAESNRELCAIHAVHLGKIGKALEYCDKDLSLMEKLSQDHPSDAAVKSALAKAHETTGRVFGENSSGGNAGDFYSALEHHRKALALVEELARASPDDLELQNWQGRMSLLTGDDLVEVGRNSEALPLHQQCTRTFELLTHRSDNPKYARALIVAYQRLGDISLVDGHFAESVPYYRKQLEMARKLAADDPRNMDFQTSVAASETTLGHGLWRSGHVDEGLAEFRLALSELTARNQGDSMVRGLEATIRTWMGGALERKADMNGALHSYLEAEDAYAAVCKADPNDIEDCLGVVGLLDRIGRIHLRQGKVREAVAEYQAALATAEPLAEKDKPNLEAVYAIVNVYYGMGETGRAGALPAREACRWYRKAGTANARIVEWRAITPDEFDARDPKDIAARLSACRESGASILSRR